MPKPGLPFFFFLFLFGCNGFSHSVDDSVKSGIADAQDTLRKQDEQARNEYSRTFQAALSSESDTVIRSMILKLNNYIEAGTHYMDSVYGEMNLLVNDAAMNMEYTKIQFLYRGVGDSLYASLTRINDLAKSIALQTRRISKVDSLRLTVLNQPSADAWKTQDFSMLDPLTAIVFLYAFKFEIYQVGKACLPST